MVVPADGAAVTLHAYWDGPVRQLFHRRWGGVRYLRHQRGRRSFSGEAQAPSSASRPGINLGSSCMGRGELQLAKKFAYAVPVLSGPKPELTRDYETQAKDRSGGAAIAGRCPTCQPPQRWTRSLTYVRTRPTAGIERQAYHPHCPMLLIMRFAGLHISPPPVPTDTRLADRFWCHGS
ncbi:hypothetical protein GGE12_001888 [Rhizobium mongolense]|uniref:Uncharacterized protein n=1 Tax=Rhizobium mongolense TaxID=57676 RepID=A0A7W6WE34_9HYPH|nr:hypothetical protein [Rhizobium mongolense]